MTFRFFTRVTSWSCPSMVSGPREALLVRHGPSLKGRPNDGAFVRIARLGAVTESPGANVDRSGVDETTRRSLGFDLAKVVRGEVHFDGATRGIYATDSSNYRQIPL